jgi:hypothetical protein
MNDSCGDKWFTLKIECHNIAEILLKLVLNTNQSIKQSTLKTDIWIVLNVGW